MAEQPSSTSTRTLDMWTTPAETEKDSTRHPRISHFAWACTCFALVTLGLRIMSSRPQVLTLKLPENIDLYPVAVPFNQSCLHKEGNNIFFIETNDNLKVFENKESTIFQC